METKNGKSTLQEFDLVIRGFEDQHTEKFNQLIKNSFDMLVLIDEKGNQHYVSPSCKRILGYEPEELIGISVIDEMIHPEDRKKTKAGLIDIITNSTNGGAQYRHRHKNGGWVYLEAFGTNQLENPMIRSVVLNVRDITERHEAEQKLKENEAHLKELISTKDRFISIIGHDLKNPFNSIIGFSELLLDDIQNQDHNDIEEYAKIILESSIRVNDLLNNLLNWSRAQSGRIKFRPSEFDLELLIQEIKLLFEESARQKSIEIRINIPSPLDITADKDMVFTVLRNLISNAIKFSHKGGEIIIGLNQTSDHFIVSIADTGVGIKDDDLQKLFSIEYNLSTKGTCGEKGTGLGLLLCKEFIEMHNGKIWVEQNEGSGSIFKFSLPRHSN